MQRLVGDLRHQNRLVNKLWTGSFVGLLLSCGVSFSSRVFAAAAPGIGSSMGSSVIGGTASKGGNSFSLTMPVVPLTRDTAARIEYNFGAVALSIEAATMVQSEEYTAEKMLLSGDSMISSGEQAALMVTNYAQSARMAGWFWMIGAGVRTMKGIWRTNPSQLATLTGITLVPDEKGKVTHHYQAAGTTGHFRIGYRWVSESIPFALGGHVGLRHFDGKFRDADELAPDVTRLAIDDQSALRRRYMTRLEPAVEFGLVF